MNEHTSILVFRMKVYSYFGRVSEIKNAIRDILLISRLSVLGKLWFIIWSIKQKWKKKDK